MINAYRGGNLDDSCQLSKVKRAKIFDRLSKNYICQRDIFQKCNLNDSVVNCFDSCHFSKVTAWDNF